MYARPALAVAVVALCCNFALGQEVPGCGNLQNAFGPYDYRDPGQAKNLDVVERFHFTQQVEFLERGQSSAEPLSDIVYTLRAFPNHHRALNSIARLQLRGERFPENTMDVDCFFKRASTFAPEDYKVHLLYGMFLAKQKQLEGARSEYETALRLAPESVDVNYTAGLFFVEIGDIARAKQLADVAYAAGYPLPGLRNRLAAAEAKQNK
ncbi:MAG: hypothetical protein AB7G76_03585 [Steroidobacteraceae bacterium]